MSKLWKAVGILGVLVVLLAASPAAAIAQPQAFESISIRPARLPEPWRVRVRVAANGDFNGSSISVLGLLIYSYDLPGNPTPRLSSRFASKELYDIEAKAPANAISPALPERERWRRVQGMLRALLADRFKLVIRTEQKTLPVYALTVASGGPKLQKSPIAEKDCIFDTGSPDSCHNFIPDRGHPLKGKGIDMDDVAQYLENWMDLPVVNRTGLSGLYAVQTEGWKPLLLPPRPPGYPQTPDFDDLPSIFSVLGKLGLELKKQEAAVPVYTIESIGQPGLDR